jgi:hypothetical protein
MELKMNNRIKELESQCWEERKYGPAWFDYNKFAKLIVKDAVECIDKVHDDVVDDIVKYEINEEMSIIMRLGILSSKERIFSHFRDEL